MTGQRRKPYTTAGIGRVPCTKCGRPSSAQWHLTPCANPHGSRWIGLCRDCDLLLNAMVLDFLLIPDRGALMAAYKCKVNL